MEDQPCTRVRARQWSRLRERVAKTQALNLKDGSPGDFTQSVVHTQQTGVSGGHLGTAQGWRGDGHCGPAEGRVGKTLQGGTKGREKRSASLTVTFHCALVTNTSLLKNNSGSHFVMYGNIKSLCCARGTKTVL